MRYAKIVLVAAAALFWKTPLSSAEGGQVTFYASGSAELTKAIAEAFTKLHPDIKVNSIFTGSGVLRSRLEAEKDHPRADVYYATSDELASVSKLLDSYKTKDHDIFPSYAVGSDNKFYAYTLNIYTILVNTDEVAEDQAPKCWKDLADPKYKGKLAFANPAELGGAYGVLAEQLQLYGWDHIRALIGNGFIVPQTNLVFTQVQRGEHPIGLTEESKSWELANKGYHVKVIYPCEGTAFRWSGLGIVKGGPNPEIARLFADFHNSAAAHELNVAVRNRRSVRPDVSTPKGLPDLASVKVLASYDEQKAMEGYSSFITKFGELVGK